MDLDFSEEQKMVQKMARAFLTENCPKSLVREMEEDEKGYSPELWKKIADLGWMGFMLPEEYDGTGGNVLDMVVLLEEMGRALLPGPFVPTVVYASLPILHFGTKEQKRKFLPKIAAGELIMTLALTEPSMRYDESGIEVQANKANSDWIINGTKLFVPDAHLADWLICAGRAPEGVTLFLVKTKSAGVKCTLLRTMASDRQCEVLFDKVKVPEANILGEVGKGWEIVEKIKEWGALAQCALISGGIQQVLEMSVDYAKLRVQFDKPIGSFQAISHKCVNMAMDVDGVKYLTYQAAWKLSEGLPAALDIAMAKAWASDASSRVCIAGCQIFGATGVALDTDTQLYYRKVKAMELAFGDANTQREMMAQQMGL